MFLRHLNLDLNESHLLLGARGTGKSTLAKHLLSSNKSHFVEIDLLKPSDEERFGRKPETLIEVVADLPPQTTHVFIDEIQKAPALLDVCHHLIEVTSKKFILTGSSARKLRRGSANLLAGRALSSSLFPLTSFELGKDFQLDGALAFGTLPKIWSTRTDTTRRKFLETYALTYVREEVQIEQLIRVLDPFRKFLSVAAQMNGKILNFATIARDVGADDKTVKNYFQILEDTLLGFFVEAFDTSVRKRVKKAPKFYFFDTGVKRALARQLTIPVAPGTYEWGNAFEHFVIAEMHRLCSYSGNQFALSYLRTEGDLEIDIICERPGRPLLLIEIKSTDRVTESQLKPLLQLGKDIDPNAELAVFSCDPIQRRVNGVRCCPWQIGLAEYFVGPDLPRLQAYHQS